MAKDFRRLILLQKRSQPIVQDFFEHTLHRDKFNWQYANEPCFKEISLKEFIEDNLDGSCNYSLFYNSDYSQVLFIVGRDEDSDEDGSYIKSKIRWAVKEESVNCPQEKLVKLMKTVNKDSYHIVSINTLLFPSTGKKDFEFKITDTKKHQEYLFQRKKEQRVTIVNQLLYKSVILTLWEKFPHVCSVENFRNVLDYVISESRLVKHLGEVISINLSVRDFESSNRYYVYDIRNELKYRDKFEEVRIDKYLGCDSMSNKNVLEEIDVNHEEFCFLMIISQIIFLIRPVFSDSNVYNDMYNFANRIVNAGRKVYVELKTTGDFTYIK